MNSKRTLFLNVMGINLLKTGCRNNIDNFTLIDYECISKFWPKYGKVGQKKVTFCDMLHGHLFGDCFEEQDSKLKHKEIIFLSIITYIIVL